MNYGTKVLEALIKKIDKMSPEEYSKLYNQATKDLGSTEQYIHSEKPYFGTTINTIIQKQEKFEAANISIKYLSNLFLDFNYNHNYYDLTSELPFLSSIIESEGNEEKQFNCDKNYLLAS